MDPSVASNFRFFLCKFTEAIYWSQAYFTRKIDTRGNTIFYKVRLVAQGLSQRPEIDFDQTYSSAMDTTSFRFFLAITVQLSFYIYLLDVVIAYLHDILDTTLFFHSHLVFSLIFHFLHPVGTLALRYLRHYRTLNRLVVSGIITYATF